jgi:dUTP pyrophosphatase
MEVNPSEPLPTIRFCRIDPKAGADIPLPRYMTPQAAGMDLHAAVTQDLIVEPGDIRLIPTGLMMAIPSGYEAQIRPRSGLAVKHGIGLINSPGTIDADYRGEVQVAVINLGKHAYTIRRGDRIAQMVIHRVYQAGLEEASFLDETIRNAGGFGHTGK